VNLRLEEVLRGALAASEETESFDFKGSFEDSTECWVDLVKDIAAFANSGGGAVVFGLTSSGQVTGSDLSSLVTIDPAKVADKFKKYAGIPPPPLEKRIATKDGETVVALLIGAAAYPIPFSKPGTYPAPAAKQEKGIQQLTEFSQGTVYFRHGAKSEVAEHSDFVHFYERKLDEKRRLWFEGIRQIIEAPEGKTPVIVYQAIGGEGLTQDGPPAVSVAKYVKVDPDRTHPHTPSELLVILNARLAVEKPLTHYDVQAVRSAHGLDAREDFVFRIHKSSPRYSEQCVEWIVGCYEADSSFFAAARVVYSRGLAERRQNQKNGG
jgi:hypothetical protein